MDSAQHCVDQSAECLRLMKSAQSEAEVGSQSADTIKFGFSSRSNLWKQSLRTEESK